ncbi:MAG: polymer-forming cytoskeletal protein [Pyrinomonadaceae bacterium]
MIRMGRNRDDQDTSYQPQAPVAPTNPYSSEPQASSTRAISESDSMARDIKEGRLSGFVGHGTTLTGETEFHAMLRVDGHLIGTVTSEAGTLIIGTNGQVDANISVAAAMVNGSINGDVVATEKLHLGRTARVMGNISSPRLIIEEGAVYEGTCSMLKARETHEEEAIDEAQYEEAELEPVEIEEVDDEVSSALFEGSEPDSDGEEQADAARV